MGGTGTKNKVADTAFTKTPEVGDTTAVGASTTTVTESPKADFSTVNVQEIIKGLEGINPPKENKLVDGTGKNLAAVTANEIWKQGDAYVEKLLSADPKASKNPAASAVTEAAAKHAKSKEVDETVALMDKRIVWLKDSMKEMAKYYIWAQAELKRGVTVQTITNKATYNEVIEKMQKDQQETALDSGKLIESLMGAFRQVSGDIEVIETHMNTARAVIFQADGLLDQIAGVRQSTVTQCDTFTKAAPAWKSDPKTKTCTALMTSIDKVVKDCKSNPHKDTTAVETFKTWFNGPEGKEKFLSEFREVFAVYQAILAAFRTASGQ